MYSRLPLLVIAAAMTAAPLQADLTGARVVADETVATSPAWNSGASPTWCMGAPLVVRDEGGVWASISVRDAEAPSYCNNHWELWRKPAAGAWEKISQGPAASEREPCPLFLLNPQSLAVSMHPKILERSRNSNGEISWYCQPALGVFEPKQPTNVPKLWLPEFGAAATFTQHSYRSVGVDSTRGECLLMVMDGEDVYHPTWRDSAGAWHPLEAPAFPIRACYANVVFRDRVAHVLAIGDVVEPNAEWKAEKFRVLQRKWDYAFRRLFYAWTPNVAAAGFRPPLEIDSAEDTGGWILNLDLLLDAQKRVHLLWVRRTFDYDFLRDRFFPEQPNIESVMHAVIEQGRVTSREELMRRELPAGGADNRRHTSGRLHELPDGRLVAVLAAPGAPGGAGLFLQELDPHGKASAAAVRLALTRPAPTGMFFTNTPRGGSQPDNKLDLLASETNGDQITLRYLQVHIP